MSSDTSIPSQAGAQPVPFSIAVDHGVLADLRERLARTRWPIEAKAAPWTYGTSLAFMQDIVAYWLNAYDWRLWEKRLNHFPNFHALIDGKRVHFMREQGSGNKPLPLLLTHGWPGSVAEFLDVVEPLAHPERFGGNMADAFTVIVPSLPGYGFSDPPDGPAPHREVAGIWHKLMTESLGHARYVAQGGDIGAIVTSWLALDYPREVTAIHLNLVALQPVVDATADPLDADERAWQTASDIRRAGETAYQQIQGTKPQTLSYGLTDSPAGLAAWILEKFHGWTTPGSEAPPPFDRGHLLTNVMLHWLAGPNAPTWSYRFSFDGSGRRLPAGQRVEVPTGMLLFPQDLSVPPPDRWIRRAYNLVHRRDAPRGGHFAALENGPLFVEEVRSYFRRFRDNYSAR